VLNLKKAGAVPDAKDGDNEEYVAILEVLRRNLPMTIPSGRKWPKAFRV